MNGLVQPSGLGSSGSRHFPWTRSHFLFLHSSRQSQLVFLSQTPTLNQPGLLMSLAGWKQRLSLEPLGTHLGWEQVALLRHRQQEGRGGKVEIWGPQMLLIAPAERL